MTACSMLSIISRPLVRTICSWRVLSARCPLTCCAPPRPSGHLTPAAFTYCVRGKLLLSVKLLRARDSRKPGLLGLEKHATHGLLGDRGQGSLGTRHPGRDRSNTRVPTHTGLSAQDSRVGRLVQDSFPVAVTGRSQMFTDGMQVLFSRSQMHVVKLQALSSRLQSNTVRSRSCVVESKVSCKNKGAPKKEEPRLLSGERMDAPGQTKPRCGT